MRRALIALTLLALAVVAGPLLASELLGWSPDPSHLPPRHRTIDLPDGRSVHVAETGDPDGVPVVLVHGLPGAIHDWASFPDALAAAGPYRVVAYDRIGYGYSSREASEERGYTYASNAAELRGLLDALGMERAVLVGWSYGGAVVQTAAARHPERASHLVLVGSLGPTFAPAEEGDALGSLLRSPLAEPVLAWVRSVPPLSQATTRAALAESFARERAIPPGWLETTRALLALPGTLHTLVQETRRSDPAALQPARLQVPALVVHGAEDYAVPYSVGEDLHRRLPDSRFVPVLQGSHMLPVTHPAELAEAVHELVGAF